MDFRWQPMVDGVVLVDLLLRRSAVIEDLLPLVSIARTMGMPGKIRASPLEDARGTLGSFADALALDLQATGAVAERLAGSRRGRSYSTTLSIARTPGLVLGDGVASHLGAEDIAARILVLEITIAIAVDVSETVQIPVTWSAGLHGVEACALEGAEPA